MRQKRDANYRNRKRQEKLREQGGRLNICLEAAKRAHQILLTETDYEPGEGLTDRQRLFVEAQVFKGWEEAKRISGYSQSQIWRLSQNDAIRMYKDYLFLSMPQKLGIAIYDIILQQRRICDDPKTSARIKEKILERFICWIEGGLEL